MGDITRRHAMKTALKAGAYASPVIIGASSGFVLAVTPARYTNPPLYPPTVYSGSNATPGGTVNIAQATNFFRPGGLPRSPSPNHERSRERRYG